MKILSLSPLLFALALTLGITQTTYAQNTTTTDSSLWQIGGGLGLDFANLILVNPKVGAGENRIGIGGNTSFYAKYKNGRVRWNNAGALLFGVQKLGRGGGKPFQKSQDEIRISSLFSYDLTENNPLAYAFDVLFLSQLTPTYEGNFLSYQNSPIVNPISKFFSPATLTVSPGMTYKPDNHFTLLVSPASLKLTMVADDVIAQMANADKTNSLHGNPYGRFDSEQAFRDTYRVKPKMIGDSIYYANTYFQLGATVKATYQNKFWKNSEGKERLSFASSLNLFTNYLREPSHIDMEWITQTDLMIFKGLSLTLITNLFYDHDILVQLDRDSDINTGVNGYESTGRRASYTQTILLKYNFIF